MQPTTPVQNPVSQPLQPPIRPPQVVQPLAAVAQAPVIAQPQTTKKKSTGIYIGLGIVATGLLAAGLYFFFMKTEIDIPTQAPGTLLHINKLTMHKNGYLIIKELDIYKGVVHIGSSGYLEPYTYERFDLPLFEASVLTTGGQYSAIVYEDSDNDQSLDLNIDKPMKNIFGFEVKTRFTVR